MHLQDWERQLQPYLSQVELLGEIPLEESAFLELEQALANFVRSRDITNATRCLKNDYPAAFVTYLAFKAAFNDERSFWDKVAGVIGLESAGQLFHPAHHWGKLFLEINSWYPNLRRFSGISGLQYITPIRLHGGIPAFSLPDFFRHILLPSVQKASYDDLPDNQVLQELLNHYTAELFVDDVVRHFFAHGGEPAQRFFCKCRKMARQAHLDQPLPAPKELGLRPYVVQAFETFREQSSEPSMRRRRPRLFFDPYTPGFRIVLPPQPLNLEQARMHYDGRLYNAETGEIYAEERHLRARRRGADWELEEIEWLLEEPLESIQVGVFPQAQEDPLFSYNLRLLPSPGYPPLLVFGYPDGILRRLSPTIPAQVLWLFFPSGVELSFVGTARQVEALHPFPPPWDAWQAGAWDLEGIHLLRLLKDSNDICPPIVVSALREPMLTPSSITPQVTPLEEKPLYSALPQVKIPLRDMQNPSYELEGWNITLESRYAAQPSGKWEAIAAHLPYQILADQSYALLSLTPWLGETPFGTYHLTCRHRGHASIELPFRICAGMEIRGLQPIYLPNKNGAQEVCFRVILPQGCHLYSETPDVEIKPAGQVIVAAKKTQVDLSIELSTKLETIRLPLRLIIPRLRWTLLLQPGAALEWQHQPISLPLPELLQSDLSRSRPRLRMDLDCFVSEKPRLALHLITPGRDEPLQYSESCSLTAHWAEFDLSVFFDTLRSNGEESVFEFHLKLLGVASNVDTSLPVLRLLRELDIRVCRFELRADDGWCLHWYEPRPLRHRRLRLWSLWQPWADPIEIPLPDNALPSDSASNGWWMYDIPEEFGLPPSEYRAHFVAVAPYEKSNLPDFPPENAIHISMGLPQERLYQIDRQLENAKPGRAFSLHFEKLCIYHSQNRPEQKQTEIQWCLGHWREAGLIHLEALQRWLEEYDDAENQHACRIYLFRQEKLAELKKHPTAFIEKYLTHLLNVRTLKPESASIILEIARDPQSILLALKFLLQSNEEIARTYFWHALEEGRFSETDSTQILAQYPEFARQLLKDAPASSSRMRLLGELSRYMDFPEWVVKTGYFVLFDAGWGKILEIQGGSRPESFLFKEEQPTLQVELMHWPGQKVEINLVRGEIALLGRSGAYRCDCQRFVALWGKDYKDIWKNHWAICGKSVNLSIPATFPLTQTLIYQATPPLDVIDTRSL